MFNFQYLSVLRGKEKSPSPFLWDFLASKTMDMLIEARNWCDFTNCIKKDNTPDWKFFFAKWSNNCLGGTFFKDFLGDMEYEILLVPKCRRKKNYLPGLRQHNSWLINLPSPCIANAEGDLEIQGGESCWKKKDITRLSQDIHLIFVNVN